MSPIKKLDSQTYGIKRWFFMVSVPLTVLVLGSLFGVGYHKIVNAQNNAVAAVNTAEDNATEIARVKENYQEDVSEIKTAMGDMQDDIGTMKLDIATTKESLKSMENMQARILNKLDKMQED